MMDAMRDAALIPAMPTLERRARIRAGDALQALNRMLEIRVFEEHVQMLFLEGAVRGTTHTCQGQEAVCVGVSSVLEARDRVLCTYRGHGWALALGTPASAVLAEIMGKPGGCAGGAGGSMHLCSKAVGLWPTMAIVGAQLPIAAGAAMASQAQNDGAVTVAVFGDGAANIGAFHETLNLAALWHLPLVFLCENNLYGEYSRISQTTAISDIATRAAAYNIPGVIVDGQEISKVAQAVGDAVDRARTGAGPTLVEAKTYRFVGHSRTDPAKYRLAGELDAWRLRDPIRLLAAKIHVEEPEALVAALTDVWEDATGNIVQAVKEAPEPTEDTMFSYVYAQ